jgi:hypothetical protein
LPAPVSLAPENVMELGQTLRLGDLEIKPVRITLRSVPLERRMLDGEPEWREGGERALWLTIRLRNVSKQAEFSPLDEVFLREPDRGLPPSYIESASCNERLYLYPLPVQSEWTIAGQAIGSLRPGEMVETAVVSAAEAPVRLPRDPRWRLQLRVGPDAQQTATIGIRFRPDQVEGLTGDSPTHSVDAP